MRYSRSPSAVLADIASGKKVGVGSGYSMLGPGDVFGEIAFFTEVPQLEVRACVWESVGCRPLLMVQGAAGSCQSAGVLSTVLAGASSTLPWHEVLNTAAATVARIDFSSCRNRQNAFLTIHACRHLPQALLLRLPAACPPLPPQLVRSLTVCRVLVVPRPAYAALAADFPLSSTAMLEALQRNAEQVNMWKGLRFGSCMASVHHCATCRQAYSSSTCLRH